MEEMRSEMEPFYGVSQPINLIHNTVKLYQSQFVYEIKSYFFYSYPLHSVRGYRVVGENAAIGG